MFSFKIQNLWHTFPACFLVAVIIQPLTHPTKRSNNFCLLFLQDQTARGAYLCRRCHWACDFYSEFVWNRSEETKKRTMTFAANRWVLPSHMNFIFGMDPSPYFKKTLEYPFIHKWLFSWDWVCCFFFFENYVCHNNRKNAHHTACRKTSGWTPKTPYSLSEFGNEPKFRNPIIRGSPAVSFRECISPVLSTNNSLFNFATSDRSNLEKRCERSG